MEWIRNWFERQAFGVCEWCGDRMRIPSADIRKFFIYASFLTVGSPVILYLIMAFWLRMGALLGLRERKQIWDL